MRERYTERYRERGEEDMKNEQAQQEQEKICGR
jgi:hypothetical protein